MFVCRVLKADECPCISTNTKDREGNWVTLCTGSSNRQWGITFKKLKFTSVWNPQSTCLPSQLVCDGFLPENTTGTRGGKHLLGKSNTLTVAKFLLFRSEHEWNFLIFERPLPAHISHHLICANTESLESFSQTSWATLLPGNNASWV